MPQDDNGSPSAPPGRAGPRFTEADRRAAQAAKAAKRADAQPFGHPEVFVVVTGGRAYTWELRRFGGIVLQRSTEVFPDTASARAAGEKALAVMLATPGLQTFKRRLRST